MATNYVQHGNTIDYTATATHASGDVVVIGEQLGVLIDSAVSGDVVTAAMEGVFQLPKVSAAVIAKGESVIWDVSAGAFDDNAAVPATGDVSNACTAWEDGIATQTTIKVKLNTGKGTVA